MGKHELDVNLHAQVGQREEQDPDAFFRLGGL
jgi:hypothetical protein